MKKRVKAQTELGRCKANSGVGASGFSSDDTKGGRTVRKRTFVTIVV